MEYLQTIIANSDKIFTVIGALVTFATTIVAITPTTKDDAILAKIVKILDHFSVVNPKK
jgi:hypothetical protein